MKVIKMVLSMATIGTIFYSTSDRIFSRFDTIYERVGRTNIAPAHRRQKWHANGQCFRVSDCFATGSQLHMPRPSRWS